MKKGAPAEASATGTSKPTHVFETARGARDDHRPKRCKMLKDVQIYGPYYAPYAYYGPYYGPYYYPYYRPYYGPSVSFSFGF
jgi:hypothetical protein